MHEEKKSVARAKKKICDLNNLYFLKKRVHFILMFFQEELASLLSAGIQFPRDLES